MIQFLDLPRTRSTGEKLMEGLGRASQTIPELIGAYQQRKQMDALSKDILSLDPENRTNQALAKVLGSGLPPEAQLPIFKLLSITDPFKTQQQERLSKDSILNRYSKRIAEVDASLKSGYGDYDEREKLIAQRKALQQERDQLLGFKALDQDQDVPAQDTEPVAAAPTTQATPTASPAKKKIKFDAKNPQHRKASDQMLKKYGGDREKAGEALSLTFEL